MAPLSVALVTVLAANPAWAQNVGAGVEDALEAHGVARVLVGLRAPPDEQPGLAAKRSSQGLAAKRSRVRTMQGDVLRRMASHEFRVVHRYEVVPALAGLVSREGLARLLEDPQVERVDLDAPGSGDLAQSIHLIHADALQQLEGLTGAGVTVAVLDSGIDRNHPNLAGALVGEQCFCSGGGGCCPGGGASQSGSGAAVDDNRHGTHVTSILAGNGSVGSVGAAPDAQIVAVKVLDRNNGFCCSSDVVAGLDWIIANRPDVRVVNMSLGTFATFAGDCDSATAFTMAFAGAIDTLTENGVAVFAASGNGGLRNAMKAPACVSNAISVGAVGKDRVVSSFSNSGITLDLLAPGAGIRAARLGGRLLILSGTSMAAPHAAGTAALLLEARPRLTPTRVLTALAETGAPVLDARNGLVHPLIDAEAAFFSLEVCDDGSDNDDDGLVDAEDPDCPPVEIDIRPHERLNRIPIRGMGTVPVALFGFEDLDGTDVDVASLAFGPAGAAPRHDLTDPEVLSSHFHDVDGDGITDLVSHYRLRETGIDSMDAEACLRGTIAAEAFRSCDEVVPLCRRDRPQNRRPGVSDIPDFSLCSHPSRN
jgi:subtilisin family serine protease